MPNPSQSPAEDGDDLVAQAMHAMEAHTGTVPGRRRAHPRGVALRGRFTATAEIAPLTVAEHLQDDEIDTVVRLSNAAGSPHAPDRDSAGRGAVLGLAVRFALPSGGHSTWAAANLPNFPARTPEDFVKITSAQRRSPRTGAPNPLRLLGYVVTHPYALPGLKGIATVPAVPSFAVVRFNGLHAYHLVNGEGRRRAFRYSWVPETAAAKLTDEENRTLPPQYLTEEIARRVEKPDEPVAWRLVLQMAAPGDPVNDVTRQWPKDRELITAGRLVLDRLHEDQDLVEGYVFDPVNVPPGIECSDDPILHFRPRAYGESYLRRTREKKPE